MWISLADSIHKIILIIVKIFDIKSSLTRTPTLLLQLQSFSISIVILSIQSLTNVYLVFSQSFSLHHFKSVHKRTIYFPSVTIYASVTTPLSSLSFFLGIFPNSSSTFSLLRLIWPHLSFIAVPSILVQHVLLHL